MKTNRRCIVATHLRHRMVLYHSYWFLLRDLVRPVRCCFQCVFCCSFLAWNIFTDRFRFPKLTKQLVTKILFQIWKKQEISEKIINVVSVIDLMGERRLYLPTSNSFFSLMHMLSHVHFTRWTPGGTQGTFIRRTALSTSMLSSTTT